MQSDSLLRAVRRRAGLTLRELASRASTSHSTLAAYESGSKVPTVRTLDRIVTAAGFALDPSLAPRVRGRGSLTRGDELAAVLDLAEQFPARHARHMAYPPFPRTPR